MNTYQLTVIESWLCFLAWNDWALHDFWDVEAMDTVEGRK